MNFVGDDRDDALSYVLDLFLPNILRLVFFLLPNARMVRFYGGTVARVFQQAMYLAK